MKITLSLLFFLSSIFLGGETFTEDGLTYEITSSSNPAEVSVLSGTVTNTLIIPRDVTNQGITYRVVEINREAFRDAMTLTSVTLPESMRAIDSDAFFNTGLTEVIALGTTPHSLEDNSFGIRTSINLTVPSGTEDAYLSNGWTGFATVNGIPYTFEENSIVYGINSLSINTVDVVSSTATGDVNIPETVTFDGTVYTVTTIRGSAFQENQLTSVTLPNTITEIGLEAFRNNQLTSVILPTTITKIGVGAFRDNLLTTIELPNTITTIGERAFLNNQLTHIRIPASLTVIETSTFSDNELTTVDLPEGITTIRSSSFTNNNLTSITIPESVQFIAFFAFSNNSLTEIKALGTIPPILGSDTIFIFGNPSNIDLFVPMGASQAYLDAGWTGFNTTTETTFDIVVAPKVFLQGASLNPIAGEEDLMRDSLRESGLLPTTSPYGDGATVSPTVFTTTGANAIVDWVLVELREGPDNENTTVIASKAALLQRDGDVVDVDGVSTVTFTEDAGDYFIAIRHRNHIGVLASVPASLNGAISTLDFTQDAAFAKGENLALTMLVNGTFAMIAGDADGSSQILNTDITEALGLAGGGEAYNTADADMNGFVLNSDIQILILANSGTVQQFE